MQYQVNWAVGGIEVIEAESPEQAHDVVTEMVSRNAQWVDVDVTKL